MPELVTAFPKYQPEEVTAAVLKLVTFEHVKKVYLHTRADFVEVQVGPGRKIRQVAITHSTGEDGHQVTALGKETIAGFCCEKAKGILLKWVEKFAEKYVPILLAFLLGVLLSSIFGFDIRELRGGGPK
jgi:hypothetical protein